MNKKDSGQIINTERIIDRGSTIATLPYDVNIDYKIKNNPHKFLNNKKIIADKSLISVKDWIKHRVTLDPANTTRFSICYLMYEDFTISVLRLAPCTKKVFGVAFREIMSEYFDDGSILESRTGGLNFKGIKVIEQVSNLVLEQEKRISSRQTEPAHKTESSHKTDPFAKLNSAQSSEIRD